MALDNSEPGLDDDFYMALDNLNMDGPISDEEIDNVARAIGHPTPVRKASRTKPALQIPPQLTDKQRARNEAHYQIERLKEQVDLIGKDDAARIMREVSQLRQTTFRKKALLPNAVAGDLLYWLLESDPNIAARLKDMVRNQYIGSMADARSYAENGDYDDATYHQRRADNYLKALQTLEAYEP